jgi:hypothetical protein
MHKISYLVVWLYIWLYAYSFFAKDQLLEIIAKLILFCETEVYAFQETSLPLTAKFLAQ